MTVDFVCSTIKYMGENSLYEKLKNQGYTTNVQCMSSSIINVGGLQITIDITDEGLRNYMKITEMILSYIRKIEKAFSSYEVDPETIYNN